MADVHTKQQRSFNMAQIKSKDTKPELLVRKFLFANGFRYRLNDKKLPGKPDIVLPQYKGRWESSMNEQIKDLPDFDTVEREVQRHLKKMKL